MRRKRRHGSHGPTEDEQLAQGELGHGKLEPEQLEDDEPSGRSRASLKRERVHNEKALAQLAKDLLALRPVDWSRLLLSEEAVDALADGQRITSHSARERHLRRVRSLLRSDDWMALRRRLDQLRSGTAVDATSSEADPALRWSEVLIVHGDAGLARFIEEHPDVDRTGLRRLLRNVQNAGDMKKTRARETLESALRSILRG